MDKEAIWWGLVTIVCVFLICAFGYTMWSESRIRGIERRLATLEGRQREIDQRLS